MVKYKKKLIQTKPDDDEGCYTSTEIIYEKSVQCIPQDCDQYDRKNEVEAFHASESQEEITKDADMNSNEYDRKILHPILHSGKSYQGYRKPDYYANDTVRQTGRKITTYSNEMKPYDSDGYPDILDDPQELSRVHLVGFPKKDISFKHYSPNCVTDSNCTCRIWPANDRIQSTSINPKLSTAYQKEISPSNARENICSCPLCSTQTKRWKEPKPHAKHISSGHITLQSSVKSAKNIYSNAITVYERMRERPIILLIVVFLFLYLTSH